MESHLLQMRGLKHYFMCHIDDQTPVASFTDAWIETEEKEDTQKSFSRIFYRCVD